MPIQWHPLLTRFLQRDYGDRLHIQREFPLGELPLRADFILIRRRPEVDLPYPLNYLGQTTLMEYEGPDETVSQPHLQLLDIHAHLYVFQQGLSARRDLVLWLVGSQFAAGLSAPGLASLEERAEVGPGLQRGVLDGFETYLMDLARVPMTEELLCFLLVTKARLRQLAEFLLDRRERQAYYLNFMHLIHREALEEVLNMHGMTPEELEIDAEALIQACGEEGIIELLGEDRIIHHLGEDRIIHHLGEDRIIHHLGEDRIIHHLGEDRIIHHLGEDRIIDCLGEEQALQTLLRRYGKEHLQQTLERLAALENAPAG